LYRTPNPPQKDNERILENLKINFPEIYAKLTQEGAV